ncbi:MAG: DUF433 domain-containing protein [Abditibacteriales bacterium]|nr:DUF433 domain-containing protein [Abditibacteriales bacterium]MDW8366472.1 DUF433 domain-containing protein [Abditibacteriales bacterium]
MCEHCSTYKHLEARPHKWQKQLWIKGRNMTVWHVIAAMRAEHETPEQTAKNRGLPLEAVLEAMHYYIVHKDIVEADTEEEKRILVEEFAYQLD